MNDYHYGVVVGINAYPGISDLLGPVADSKLFYDWLWRSAGAPIENLRHVTSPDTSGATTVYEARPIGQEFNDALFQVGKLAKRQIDNNYERWKESRLYIYVAGHGIIPQRGEAALLLANAQPDAYYNIELHEYLEHYRKCGIVKEIVLIADCCRNGFSQVRQPAVPFNECPRYQDRVVTLVGYAAGRGDPANEKLDKNVDPNELRGYFTQAVLDGLRGHAKVDPRYGQITSTTLGEYVGVAVAEATRKKRVPQLAEMTSDTAVPILFGRPAAPPAVSVKIQFPLNWTQPIDLLHPDGHREVHAVAGPTWNTELVPGLYSILVHGGNESPFAHCDFVVTARTHDITI